MVKALRMRPEKSEEILNSPVEHLVQFFREAEPEAAVGRDNEPLYSSPSAERIVNFLPELDAIRPADMKHPEVRQIEDALTSLKLAVDGLLRECKLELGEAVRG